MSQTSIIAAALVVAFIVFITVRGELPAYLSIFSGTAPAPAKTTGAAGASGASFTAGASGGGISVGGITVGYDGAPIRPGGSGPGLYLPVNDNL